MSQFDRLKQKADIENERENESKYWDKFVHLMTSKKDLLLKSPVTTLEPNPYKAEQKILRKAIEAESNALIGGLFLGVATFLSVRFFPTLVVRRLGGKSKYDAMKQKEAAFKVDPKNQLKRVGGFLFEGTFGFWAGYRGYHMALSLQSEDALEELTQIPLCEGRSIVSDNVCHEWTRLINHEIPSNFWLNLDSSDSAALMEHEKRWRAVLEFSQNCMKRKSYEEDLRKKLKIREDEPISIPPPGVPEGDI